MDCENNFAAEFLSSAHLDFIVGYLELERQREQAAIDALLKEKSLKLTDRVMTLYRQPPSLRRNCSITSP